MDDGTKELSDAIKEGDELPLGNVGGVVGGDTPPKLILKRSELAVLRRMADRYPIVEQERRKAVEQTMDIIVNANSKRLKVAAVKALTAMDRVNLDEMKVYLAAKGAAGKEDKGGSTVQVNVQIVEQIVTKDNSEVLPPVQVVEKVIESTNGRNGRH